MEMKQRMARSGSLGREALVLAAWILNQNPRKLEKVNKAESGKTPDDACKEEFDQLVKEEKGKGDKLVADLIEKACERSRASFKTPSGRSCRSKSTWKTSFGSNCSAGFETASRDIIHRAGYLEVDISAINEYETKS